MMDIVWTCWAILEQVSRTRYHHVDDVSVCPDMIGSSDLPRLVRFAEWRKTFNASVQGFSSCLSSKQAQDRVEQHPLAVEENGLE
ncbi:hypothetical protein GUITHDRAFT_156204 [Guillardia theta CCMP2712]|uniref:Uncharacterized protein n=1 Tax=Guillardia theta (strain CCMP2712) TaxID=905079 RepID=L1IAN9_GUITC|nr:hypothetical protein GUITHDRAFT_156204 [Guillardia theta CCMP2712]EKX32910.1 hypothetical protein GUITHDRAFT_156204 [Guillardia theta CCMP2712]|eukprot:XP_005819890.1 hypothetical protein GUITHDRAFT_156204 [Guillardia theta CCMP2712]